jgi:hypothetical protein
MLKGNLSTRPFYNERLVSLVVVLATAVGIALSVFNVSRLYALSSERARLRGEQQLAEQEAERVRAAAAATQQSVGRPALVALAAATREANALIDARTFSWTTFFGYVEKTLPVEARLIAVSPTVEHGEFRIAMIVNARSPKEIEDFIDALMGTGAFYDLIPDEQQRNDDGSQTAKISGAYLPPPPTAKPDGGQRP